MAYSADWPLRTSLTATPYLHGRVWPLYGISKCPAHVSWCEMVTLKVLTWTQHWLSSCTWMEAMMRYQFPNTLWPIVFLSVSTFKHSVILPLQCGRSATGFCFDLAKSASRQLHALHLALTLQGKFYYLLCIYNSKDLLVTFVYIAWFSKAMGGVSQAVGSISIQWLIYERHLSLLSAIGLSQTSSKAL